MNIAIYSISHIVFNNLVINHLVFYLANMLLICLYLSLQNTITVYLAVCVCVY